MATIRSPDSYVRRIPRLCLRCRKKFRSRHVGNRICQDCKEAIETYPRNYYSVPVYTFHRSSSGVISYATKSISVPY